MVSDTLALLKNLGCFAADWSRAGGQRGRCPIDRCMSLAASTLSVTWHRRCRVTDAFEVFFVLSAALKLSRKVLLPGQTFAGSPSNHRLIFFFLCSSSRLRRKACLVTGLSRVSWVVALRESVSPRFRLDRFRAQKRVYLVSTLGRCNLLPDSYFICVVNDLYAYVDPASATYIRKIMSCRREFTHSRRPNG